MSNPSELPRSHERWARFRFSVIGRLLAAPPERGELQEQLKNLAAKKWQHPITGQRVQFGLSTIERWFYTARNEKKDPVQALRRKIRSDQGLHSALSPKLRELLAAQYHRHPNWSYQLAEPFAKKRFDLLLLEVIADALCSRHLLTPRDAVVPSLRHPPQWSTAARKHSDTSGQYTPVP